MNTIRTVFSKEVTDNFRDRRTLLTALLMGPLFGPILFAFVINLSVKQTLGNESEPLDLPVIGQENAPNLIAYLVSNNINIMAGPANREAAIEAVTNGVHDVVIVIPESFGEDLSELTPATVEVITDQAIHFRSAQAGQERAALLGFDAEGPGIDGQDRLEELLTGQDHLLGHPRAVQTSTFLQGRYVRYQLPNGFQALVQFLNHSDIR